jgi:hypothetical protein
MELEDISFTSLFRRINYPDIFPLVTHQGQQVKLNVVRFSESSNFVMLNFYFPAIKGGKLTLQGKDLKSNFKVKLTVTNFLSQSDSMEVPLKITTNPIPKVILTSNRGVTGLMRTDTYVYAQSIDSYQ